VAGKPVNQTILINQSRFCAQQMASCEHFFDTLHDKTEVSPCATQDKTSDLQLNRIMSKRCGVLQLSVSECQHNNTFGWTCVYRSSITCVMIYFVDKRGFHVTLAGFCPCRVCVDHDKSLGMLRSFPRITREGLLV
jgi:hypothetical protein